MDDQPAGAKKPRIRKSAPTLRQMAEEARSKGSMPSRKTRLTTPAKAIFRFKLPDNPITRLLRRLGRVFGKTIMWVVPSYFVNSWREVRQVTWPGRRETWRLTGAVFMFAIIFGILVTVVDLGLTELFRKVVLK